MTRRWVGAAEGSEENKDKAPASTGCAETIRFPQMPMEAEKAANRFMRIPAQLVH